MAITICKEPDFAGHEHSSPHHSSLVSHDETARHISVDAGHGISSRNVLITSLSISLLAIQSSLAISNLLHPNRQSDYAQITL
tara:strand:- start:12345 stop:12593 length:249 start_codon:yes stop_codon:yes gene_type:complete